MTILQKSKLNENQKMVLLISKERVRKTLKNLLEKLEENNKPIQTGRVKAVSISVEKKNGEINYHEGETVFTRRGVGVVEGKVWPKGDERGVLIQVRHRRSGSKKNTRLNYRPKDVMKLLIVDEQGNELPISPMFYDHLIMSIGKEVQFYQNLRKAAMLTKKQQQLLERDKIASLKGAYNLMKALEDKGLLW